MKRFSLIFICFLFLCVECAAIDVSADSAILFEPETKTVLFEKNADKKRAIASTTKIMTAVVVLENCALDEIVEVPGECVGIEGTSMYLKEGEKLSVSDLLSGLLLASGNDAAATLAHYVGKGNIKAFVSEMNATAKRLGMENSHFVNPHGLTAEMHYSTARDMALLAAYAMRVPEFKAIVSSRSMKIGSRYLANHNKLLKLYEGADGLKTGYTKAAGRCLVSSAKRDGMRLIAITLSAPDDWNDHIRMFDYGFDNYGIFKGRAADLGVDMLPVVGGEKNSVKIGITDDVTFLKELKGTEETVETEIYLPRFVYAPISEGDVVGRVEYKIGDKTIESANLVCYNSVNYKKNLWQKLWSFIKKE